MAKQLINLGNADKGNGDPIRLAFSKVNGNFDEIYATLEGFDLINSLPDISGNDGKYLTVDNGELFWGDITFPTVSELTANGHTVSVDSQGRVTVDGDPISLDYYVPIDHIPPENPLPGDLWYDTESGRTYIYYDSSWIDAAPKGATGTVLPNQNGNTGKFLTTDGSNLSWATVDGGGGLDLSAVNQDIVPSNDNTYNIGTPEKRWQHGYFANGSLYIGDIKLSNDNGTLLVQQVTDAGLETETPIGSPGAVTTDRLINGENEFILGSDGVLTLPVNGDIVDSEGNSVLGENLEIDGGNAFTIYTAELEIDGGGA